MEKKTPLYEKHVALGGKMVPFAGYLLPVQYKSGVIAEHMAVRGQAGLFDVSHMGEALLTGRDAEENLDRILSNRFTGMPEGAARYTLMLYENGGVVDDLIVYRLAQQQFFLVLNAANTEKDLDWLRSHLKGEVELQDLSPRVAQIALQGPQAKALISTVADAAQLPQKYYTFVPEMQVAGARCMVSRTGYTGEAGYELYLDPADAPGVWDALVVAGAVPCGLGARDTLRLEAAMPLYGHELSPVIDPITAGLNFAVKLEKTDFIGKGALLAAGEPKQVRAGLKVTGRGVLREEQDVYSGGKKVGVTTSGTHCPAVGVSCAMAYLDRDAASVGTSVEVDVRGRRVAAEVVPLPFYKK
ncbi:glycine cleavage system aminomethyltransferase GcvT [Anaerofilum sp. BX8]|uniref:Aminomethyltransferase n=1 Tax=Anaerofilum hominis TaxID=2763016 RepID=A0A923ID84_9FIRM|nr:glycine cleavage system aminomethyltransferase GcvT [Anaerofilum hominis]MBC5580112.1 glycine cleavage system aminomethyltransferase GcvT [Anaerofilum hominis]